MGYNTEYILEADERVDEIKEFVEAEMDTYYSKVIIEMLDGNISPPMKWYCHVKDLHQLTRKFPGVLFTLTAYGEDPGDTWIEYALRSEVRHGKAKISFPSIRECEVKHA